MAVILCWLLFLVIDSLKKSNFFSTSPAFLYQYLPGFIFWIAITLPMFRLFSKTARYSLVKRIPVLIAMGIGLGTVKNLLSWFVMFIAGVVSNRYPFSLDSLATFYSQVRLFFYMEAIIIAWVLLIVFFIIELNRNYKNKSLEAAQLQSQLANAQLESLRMQLQPHFLFNAHNTVSMLIRTQKYDQATEMISRISDLLRNSLKSQEGQFVSLEREISLIKAYLEIEQIRFEDHLQIKVDIDPGTLSSQVPHLILQPLIENAFKHGISRRLGPAALVISSEITGQTLRLKVHNSGPPLDDYWDKKSDKGIGLSNTLSRLAKLYPADAYSFEMISESDGVTTIIDLPLNDQAYA